MVHTKSSSTIAPHVPLMFINRPSCSSSTIAPQSGRSGLSILTQISEANHQWTRTAVPPSTRRGPKGLQYLPTPTLTPAAGSAAGASLPALDSGKPRHPLSLSPGFRQERTRTEGDWSGPRASPKKEKQRARRRTDRLVGSGRALSCDGLLEGGMQDLCPVTRVYRAQP